MKALLRADPGVKLVELGMGTPEGLGLKMSVDVSHGLMVTATSEQERRSKWPIVS